ncbi:hypothetical protein PLANPX_5643 [Lacipirellula parvula]|uniref:Uncharacterized protein n=1 Tax=Lacipirellula parvula TaxID=2650471 RepID=A0A5K7XL86_9BACT|nr:hypothetical protein PLANPX_5643 [Lacipirellula parvula]
MEGGRLLMKMAFQNGWGWLEGREMPCWREMKLGGFGFPKWRLAEVAQGMCGRAYRRGSDLATIFGNRRDRFGLPKKRRSMRRLALWLQKRVAPHA